MLKKTGTILLFLSLTINLLPISIISGGFLPNNLALAVEPDPAAAAAAAAGQAAGRSSAATSSAAAAKKAEEEAERAAKKEAEQTGKTFSVKNLSIKATDESDQAQNQSYLTSDNPAATLIIRAINTIVYTIGSLAFLGVVAGGFLMVTSGGNSDQINKGKEFIKFSLIGLVVTFSAFFIVAFVQTLFFELA